MRIRNGSKDVLPVLIDPTNVQPLKKFWRNHYWKNQGPSKFRFQQENTNCTVLLFRKIFYRFSCQYYWDRIHTCMQQVVFRKLVHCKFRLKLKNSIRLRHSQFMFKLNVFIEIKDFFEIFKGKKEFSIF